MGSKHKISFSKVFVWSLVSILCGCEDPKRDFYKDEMEGHDVWRLPIVKPYRLITADCFSAEGCNGWNFHSRDFLEGFTVDSLNYDNGYILIYTPYNSDNYIAIDVTLKKIYKFSDINNYKAFLRKKKIDNQLYSVKYLHNSWKRTKELPWKDEIVENNSVSD